MKKISYEDPEFKKVSKVNVSNIQNSSVLSRLPGCKAILVIKGVCLHRVGKVSSLNQLNDIDTEMIQKVLEKIFFLLQAKSFVNEIK